MYTDKTCYIEYMAGYTDNIRCDTTVSFKSSKAATGQLVYIYIYILRIYVVYVCVCVSVCAYVCVWSSHQTRFYYFRHVQCTSYILR